MLVEAQDCWNWATVPFSVIWKIHAAMITSLIAASLADIPTDAIPLKRFGEAAEDADLAVFLASDEAKFMQGAMVRTGAYGNLDGRNKLTAVYLWTPDKIMRSV